MPIQMFVRLDTNTGTQDARGNAQCWHHTHHGVFTLLLRYALNQRSKGSSQHDTRVVWQHIVYISAICCVDLRWWQPGRKDESAALFIISLRLCLHACYVILFAMFKHEQCGRTAASQVGLLRARRCTPCSQTVFKRDTSISQVIDAAPGSWCVQYGVL